MAIVKPSQAILEAKNKALQKARQERKLVEEIAKGGETLFWKSIQSKLKGQMDRIEEQMDGYLGLEPDKRVALLEARKIFKYFYSMADDMVQGIELLDKQIERLEIEVEEYSGKLRRTQ